MTAAARPRPPAARYPKPVTELMKQMRMLGKRADRGTARAVLLAWWPHVSAVAAAQAAAAEREACAQIAGDYLHAAADGTTFPTVAVVINRMAAEIAALIRARGGG